MNESLIHIDMKFSEWSTTYSIGARFSMKLFSYLFPGVLRIRLIKD